MKTMLLTAVILCGLIGSVVAQKKSTLMGDVVIGEVAGVDAAAREITIKYPGEKGTEIFSGILVDSSKLKMKDGSVQEIMPGMRVRAFYKSDHETGGQKKKINRIFRIEFLGRDEYARLRNQLKVDPATAVARAENDDLPSISPLKAYLAIAYSNVQQGLVDWINKWNRKHGDRYGKLEIVSDLEQADMLIVIASGADTMVVVLPAEVYIGDRVIKGEWSHATSYLVVKDPQGLKVLWTSVAPVFSTQKREESRKSRESIINEMEKRMKAKTRNLKK